jgi:alpha-tubulin suppressor-like RCC1 family protein
MVITMKIRNAARVLVLAVMGLGAILVGPSPEQVSAQTTPLTATGLGLLDSGRSCALLSTGGVRCWAYGARLNGNGAGDPILIAGTTIVGASKIAGGRFQHACALMIDTTVRCWGNNNNGQIGVGTTGTITATGQALGVTGATYIGVGNYHSCAVIAAGAVKCWGMNLTGQLGDGLTAVGTPTPVQVQGLTGVTQLALGRDHTCGLITDGTVKCWGSNNQVQLGLASTVISRFTPTTVPNVTGAIQITAGYQQTCALLTNGTVTCWGLFGTYSTPTTVAGLTGVTQIAGGDYHFCAIVVNGAVKCWGANNYGQLGNGTTSATGVIIDPPVSVSQLTGALGIAAGSIHTCALLAAGAVSCWGYGVGDSAGLSVNTAIPVPVAGFGSATTVSTTTTTTAATVSPSPAPAANNQDATTTTVAAEVAPTSTTSPLQLVFLPIENPTTTTTPPTPVVTSTSVVTTITPAPTTSVAPDTNTKPPAASLQAIPTSTSTSTSTSTPQPIAKASTIKPKAPAKLRKVCRVVIQNRKRVLTCKLVRI